VLRFVGLALWYLFLFLFAAAAILFDVWKAQGYP
jgi:hypothetical protein